MVFMSAHLHIKIYIIISCFHAFLIYITGLALLLVILKLVLYIVIISINLILAYEGKSIKYLLYKRGTESVRLEKHCPTYSDPAPFFP